MNRTRLKKETEKQKDMLFSLQQNFRKFLKEDKIMQLYTHESSVSLSKAWWIPAEHWEDAKLKQDAMLSQGEPRDAAISFDTTASCMRLLWYMSIYND